MPDDTPAQTIDLARLPPWLLIAVALGGGGAGLSALGLQQTDPAASKEEVSALRDEVRDLRSAVAELGFQIRLHHEKADR